MERPQVYCQLDMFTGELVDTRTGKQKKRASQQEGPRQAEMFPQRELAQFGVQANPKLPISPKTRIELAIEDARTEEEKERALREAIEEMTYPLPWARTAGREQDDT